MDELWFRSVVYWLLSPLYVGRWCWYMVRVPVGLRYEFWAWLGCYCQVQGFPWLGLLDGRDDGFGDSDGRGGRADRDGGRGLPVPCCKEAGSGRLWRAGFTVIRTVSLASVGLVSTLVSPSLVLGHGRFSIVCGGSVGQEPYDASYGVSYCGFYDDTIARCLLQRRSVTTIRVVTLGRSKTGKGVLGRGAPKAGCEAAWGVCLVCIHR